MTTQGKSINPLDAMTDDQKRQLAEYLRPYLPQRMLKHYGEREQRAAWAKKYWNDPVGWARDNVRWPEGQSLAPYQARILAAIPKHKRVCVRACHGAGKTTSAALYALWFVTTREAAEASWKVATTAGSENQLKNYLWPEIHKWSRRLRWEKMFREPFNPKAELMVLSLRLKFGHAFAASCDRPDLLEGAHEDNLAYLYDESKSVSDAVFDAAEGAFSGGGVGGREAFAFAISTPGSPVGRFWAIQQRADGFEDWHVDHITLDEAMSFGRVTQEWVDARKRQWSETSSIYVNKVEGNFCSDDQEGCIPSGWVDAAMERHEVLFGGMA